MSSSAWVDDLAVPVLCAATDLHREATVVLAVVLNIFQQFAMGLNMKEGKTERSCESMAARFRKWHGEAN